MPGAPAVSPGSANPCTNKRSKAGEACGAALAAMAGAGPDIARPGATGAALPAGSRATDEHGGKNTIKDFLDDGILGNVQKLRPIADELGLKMSQLAIAWVLQNENVATALVGASRPEQVAENVKASGVKIPAELMAAIDAALAPSFVKDPALTVSPPTRVA